MIENAVKEQDVKEQGVSLEPFYPSEKHLDYARGKLMRVLRGNDHEIEGSQRYINELAAGRYYNVIKIARKFGLRQSKASTFWRAIIAVGAIKRVEFAQMKPCLVHESELPVVIGFFERFKTLGRGWNATVKLVKESLRYSNGTNGTNEKASKNGIEKIGNTLDTNRTVYAAETVSTENVNTETANANTEP